MSYEVRPLLVLSSLDLSLLRRHGQMRNQPTDRGIGLRTLPFDLQFRLEHSPRQEGEFVAIKTRSREVGAVEAEGMESGERVLATLGEITL